MTAFTISELKLSNCILEFNLSSLNNKYFKIYFDLPEVFENKEHKFRKIIKKDLKRGKVKLKINVKYRENEATEFININKNLIKHYYKELDKINIPVDVTFSDILKLPNIIQKTGFQFSKKEWSKIYKKIEGTVEKLLKEEDKEGEEIEKDLVDKIKKIDKNLKDIKVDKNSRIDKYRKLLLKKVDELDISDIIDEDRMYKEISYFAEKIDINEEIVRIETHLGRTEKLIRDNSVEKGKKIKFFAQEMFREINTIGAKIKDAEISHLVVNIKELLGKIKEQSFNVW